MRTSDVGKGWNIQQGNKRRVLYDTDDLRAIMGSTLRPGGFSLTNRAMSFCRFPTDAVIGDIGCGLGGTMEHLAATYGIRSIGIDPSSTLLSAAQQNISTFYAAQGIAEALPFRSNACDGIVCECVLSVVTDSDMALAEFARVLKPGGYLIMSDVYLRPQGCTTRPAPQRGLGCPKERCEIEHLLYRNDFSLLLFEDHTTLLKELVAQLILAHGSLKASGVPCPPVSAGEGSRPTVRIGYFLAVAERCVS